MYVQYTTSGHIFISPDDNLDKLVDVILAIDYNEEFCLALDFDPAFIANLMKAGFLVMSIEQEGEFLLLPKLHLIRSALFFPDLHIKKSVKPMLSRYELRVNTDFDLILNRCIEVHGSEWLTEPLVETVKTIRKADFPVRPVSFGVYRNGELKAGEFGILAGRVYTSYSGYYDENSAGTVQIILMTQFLKNANCAFLDFGMPLPYKDTLGATNIYPKYFVKRFRQGRTGYPSGGL